MENDRTFYTYKITAAGSKRYYIGVSHVKKYSASVSDCINDGYYGTGGRRLKAWKTKYNSLTKEILGRYETREEAFKAEEAFVGDLWKNDENCLNHLPGGLMRESVAFNTLVIEKICEKHGLTLFMLSTCAKCTAEKAIKTKICPTHGETKFRGESCSKCSLNKRVMNRLCPIHGPVSHRGDTCLECIDAVYTQAQCKHHGLTRHRNEKCVKCLAWLLEGFLNCSLHGRTKHVNSKCSVCLSEENLSKTSLKNEVHLGLISRRKCLNHGMATFQGENCTVCAAEKQISIQECKHHGFVKHRGGSCYSCFANQTHSLKECIKHGITNHRGVSCDKCSQEKAISLKECAIHGMVKHLGESCRSCSAEKTAHTRFHKNKSKLSCFLCQA